MNASEKVTALKPESAQVLPARALPPAVEQQERWLRHGGIAAIVIPQDVNKDLNDDRVGKQVFSHRMVKNRCFFRRRCGAGRMVLRLKRTKEKQAPKKGKRNQLFHVISFFG